MPETPKAPAVAPAAPTPTAPPVAAPVKAEVKQPALDKPADKPAEKATEVANPVEAPAVESKPETKPDSQEPIAPRWFAVHTQSQMGAVNVFIKDCVRDMEANAEAAIERFKVGQGIISTPYEISAQDLGPDYKPTSADLDHHNAIEAAHG